MSTNTNTQHTPGPWAIIRHATPEYAKQYGIYAEESECVADFAIVRGNNADADAALIAAAPELLAELEALMGHIEALACEFSICEEIYTSRYGKEARAAIAKAKGGAA